jgi:hypothetical protein
MLLNISAFAFFGVLVWICVEPTSGSAQERPSSAASSIIQTNRPQPVFSSGFSRRWQPYPEACQPLELTTKARRFRRAQCTLSGKQVKNL